jgi:4-amino-4-deoxy-L-arabinose transferase-like glycosyltransferase
MAPAPDIKTEPVQTGIDKLSQGVTPWIILSCVCLGLYFNFLGSWPFIDPGETYYTEAAREMVESGQYIVPHLNYQTYFSKPILTFWLTAASYNLFGVGEAAARLPFALLAAINVLASYYVTRVIAGSRAALLAGLISASAPLLVAYTKLSCIDAAFTTFLNLSAYAFVLCVFAGKKHWWIVLWLSLGLSMLTKGPAGLLLFAIGTGLYILLSKPGLKRLAYWFACTRPLYGVAIFLATVLPWYYAVWKATKGLFLQVFFIYENLARFQGKTNMHKGSWLYYLPVLAYGIAPWFLLLPQTLKFTFFQPLIEVWFSGRTLSFKSSYRPYAREMKARDTEATAREALVSEQSNANLIETRGVFYLASWVMAVLVFFSLSKTQLDTYAMPLIAPLSVLIAVAMLKLADHSASYEGDSFAEQSKWDALWLKIVCWLIAVLTLLVGLALPVVALGVDGLTVLQRIVLGTAGVLALVGGVLETWGLVKKRLSSNLIVTALTISVLTAFIHPVAFQYFAGKKQNNMIKVASYLPNCREEVALYGPFRPSLPYYLKRPVDTISHIEQFVVATDPLPDDGLSYGPTKSGRKQIVIGDDGHMKDFAARPELKLVELFREGDWAVYELTNGYASRPKSLEESFKWMLHAGQSFTSSNDFGPLTVPAGGGDVDWYRAKH